MSFTNSREVIHEGYLIKSPPEKRIWRAKWRRRWFVLRQSGHIPGQHLLEYYTDSSCKKLKGNIDLDQCEQVDAGISLETRKINYQFTFDIRTPKRIFMLVAETETEMNKWVDCICHVCGLQIHVDEDQVSTNVPMPLNVVSQPQQLHSPEAISNSSSLELPDSPSSTYIPMSECTSGKIPFFNGDNNECFRTLDEMPPPPPKTHHDRSLSGESYDYPRQIHPSGFSDADGSFCIKSKENEIISNHGQLSQTINSHEHQTDYVCSNAPKVNWDTYPKDSENAESIYGSIFSRNSNFKADCSLIRHYSHLQINAGKSEQHAQELYENIPVNSESHSDNLSPTINGIAPPRPPKPAHLIEPVQYYQNISLQTKVLPGVCNSKISINSYDVPPPLDIVNKGSPLAYSANASPNPCLSASRLDEHYDFPRPHPEDHLHVTPPAPAGSLMRQTKHAYSNAPAGYLNDHVFSYDTQDVHMFTENYLSMDNQKTLKRTEVYTDMSVENRSPSAVYNNLPSPIHPPLVFRDLKPKKGFMELNIVHSRSCSSASSTDVSAKSPSPIEIISPPAINRGLKPRRTREVPEKPNLLTLAPPPVCRIRNHGTKRSFRKPRTPLGPMLPHPAQHSDQSSSEDEHSSTESSRRNSASEDQQKFFAASIASHGRNESEIQYLDLDLESDHVPKSPGRTSTSTVYKTVDFVKTKAFIQMRQNVEDNYRKSQ